MATRAISLRAMFLCAATSSCPVALATEFTDNLPGYVCPDGMGGAWASSTSFAGCRPTANYAAAEREVARLNLPENIAKTQSSQSVAATAPPGGAKPVSPINRCVDRSGHVTYTDGSCTAPNSQRVSSPVQRAPVPQAPAEKTLYDRAVAEIEQQYPTLNPDSPTFDRAIVQQVLAKKKAYIQKSYGEDYALRAAVADVMTPPPPPPLKVAVQIAPDPDRQEKAQHALIEATTSALPTSLIWALLMLPITLFVRWLYRRSRAASAQAAYMVGNTSVNDIARAAGGATATVQRKTAGLMEAFREGRRDAERRGGKSM